MTKSAFTPISIGYVIDSYGVKGWVKLKTDTQDFASLAKLQAIYLYIDAKWKRFNLDEYNYLGKVIRAKFNEINDRDAALSLKGTLVGVDRNAFPKLDQDEYYWTDLIGCKVVNERGDSFGLIKSLMDTGPNCVLVTENETTQHLIPFVNKHLIEVNLEHKLITVDWELDY